MPASGGRLASGLNLQGERQRPTGEANCVRTADGVYICPSGSGPEGNAGAVLSFITAAGRAIPVTITLACPPSVVVATPYNLSLSASTLWTDVLAAVGDHAG